MPDHPPLVSVQPRLLDYRGGLAFDMNLRKALAPPPDWLVWQWADKKRKLNRKHAKRAGQWSTDVVPFTREIMAMMSARSQVQRLDFMKGAQVSGTETLNNVVGYTIDHAPTSILYVSPSLTVSKRTSARIQAMVDDDPEGLGKKILPSRKRDAKNSQFEKHFPNGALYFATAKSAANLRSTAVEILLLDEFEAYPRDVEEEGSTEDVAEARGDSMGDTFKCVAVSTPAVDQTSQIKPAYLKGDQRFYFMRCPHEACNRLIYFRKENLAWTAGQPETAHYVCQACDRKIEPRHKTRMMAGGIWIPKFIRENPEAMARIEAGDTSELDAHNATVLRVSYHLPSLYSPIGWLSWAKIAKRWEEAEGVPPKMKVLINTVFGETYVEAGEAPAWESVFARRNLTLKMRQMPAWVVFLTAGADVGIDHIVISVWGWGRRKKRHLVDHFRIDGDVHDPATWEQAAVACERLYLHPHGAAMPIRGFGIDRNYHPEVVDPFVAEQGSGVMAVLGRDYLDAFGRWTRRKEKPTADTEARGARFDYLLVGSSYGKLDLYGNLALRLVEGKDLPAGWVSLPRDVGETFCKEVVSERLTYEDKKKKSTRRGKGKWVGIGATRHEALDCAVYARAVANLIGLDRWSDSDWEREEQKLADAVKDAALLREGKALDLRCLPEEVPWTRVFRNLMLPDDREETPEMSPPEDDETPVVRRIDTSPKARAEAAERLTVEAAQPADPDDEDEPPAPPPKRRTWGSGGRARQAGVVGCSDRTPSWQTAMMRTSQPASDDY